MKKTITLKRVNRKGEEYTLEQLTEEARNERWAKQIIAEIKSKKYKPLSLEERDELDRKYQIGKYRPYTIDMERLKQLDIETREEYRSIMAEAYVKRAHKPSGYNKGGQGKRQKEAEYERLKNELENG